VSRLDVASGPVQRINYVNDKNGNRLASLSDASGSCTIACDLHGKTIPEVGPGAVAPTAARR